MTVSCKPMHPLDRNSNKDPDCDLDSDPNNFVSCKQGIKPYYLIV